MNEYHTNQPCSSCLSILQLMSVGAKKRDCQRPRSVQAARAFKNKSVLANLNKDKLLELNNDELCKHHQKETGRQVPTNRKHEPLIESKRPSHQNEKRQSRTREKLGRLPFHYISISLVVWLHHGWYHGSETMSDHVCTARFLSLYRLCFYSNQSCVTESLVNHCKMAAPLPSPSFQ